MKYPKKVFVQMRDFEDTGDDSWFEAFEDIEKCEDGEVVVYELKEMKKKRTETEIIIE